MIMNSTPFSGINIFWFILIGMVFSGFSLKWLVPLYGQFGLLGKKYSKILLITIILFILLIGLVVEISSCSYWIKSVYFLFAILLMPHPSLFDNSASKS